MKTLRIFAILLVLVSFAAVEAWSAESIEKGTVTQTDTALDVNGAEYVRLIVQFDRKIGNVEYPVSLPWMAFGDLAEPAKSYAVGSEVTAVVQTRIYEGRESMTILKFVQ